MTHGRIAAGLALLAALALEGPAVAATYAPVRHTVRRVSSCSCPCAAGPQRGYTSARYGRTYRHTTRVVNVYHRPAPVVAGTQYVERSTYVAPAPAYVAPEPAYVPGYATYAAPAPYRTEYAAPAYGRTVYRTDEYYTVHRHHHHRTLKYVAGGAAGGAAIGAIAGGGEGAGIGAIVGAGSGFVASHLIHHHHNEY